MRHLKVVPSDLKSDEAYIDQIEATSIEQKYPLSICGTLKKLIELVSLGNNWDSYGAKKPSAEASLGALNLAMELFEEDTPMPEIFPVANGNVQFEWSCFGLDLEIEVITKLTSIVCFENLESGESWEKEFTYDLTELRNIIMEITSKNRDSKTPMLHVVHG